MLSPLSSKALDSLLEIIRQAGEEVLKVYARLETDWDIQFKDDLTPVTEADQVSNRIISEGLRKLWPDIPTLSEESREIPYHIRKEYEYFWLLDPLDGTKEFLKRNGEFTLNLALINRTRPLAGFISVPCKRLFYYAIKGEGAYRIQEGIEAKEKSGSLNKNINKNNKIKLTAMKLKAAEFSLDEPGLTVVVSRSHFDPETQKFIQQLNNPKLVSIGSSLKFMLLAEGKAHLYPRLGRTMEWDTAAGQVILEEAGGQILEFSSHRPLSYNKESLVNPPFLATGRILKI